MLPFSDL